MKTVRELQAAEWAALIVMGRSAEKHRSEIAPGGLDINVLLRVQGDVFVKEAGSRQTWVTKSPDLVEMMACLLTAIPEENRVKVLQKLEKAIQSGKAKPIPALVDAIKGMVERLTTKTPGEDKKISGAIEGNLSIEVVE